MGLREVLEICLALIGSAEDQDKFETLYEKYKKLLYHAARKQLRDEEMVEEAVCTVFLRVARNMCMIHESVSQETMHLLLIMTRRVAIDIQRRQERKHIPTIGMEDIENEACLSVEMGVDEGSSIASALGKLPSQYRDVLLLKFAYGYSNSEVARLLDLTVANVEKISSRSKKKLKAILQEEEVWDDEAER